MMRGGEAVMGEGGASVGSLCDAAKALASVDRSGGSPYAPLATSVLDR